MRILVVEDEHKIANAIKEGLIQEKYAVDVAYDGQSGFDLASTEEYDLILLDLLLPKMDGLLICKQLRQVGIHTPVLILTARGLVADKVAGLDAGADDYLTKPFSFEELLARVRALCRRPKNTLPTVLAVSGLKLDTVRFEVSRDDMPIELSSKEFSLLEYLMRHPGQVLSKKQIIDHVWDYEADVLPNTVEVYIGYLRQKVDKPFPSRTPLIRTLRGFGYKIGGNNV